MSASLSGLIPEFRPWAQQLYRVAAYNGLKPRITSTRRTFASQSSLYRRYLAGGSPFPAAPPGRSAHEYGYAMDMVVTPFEALAQLGALWHSWGGFWSPRDPIHFEYPGFPHGPVETAAPTGRVKRAAKALASFLIPTRLTTAEVPPGYAELARQFDPFAQAPSKREK